MNKKEMGDALLAGASSGIGRDAALPLKAATDRVTPNGEQP